MGSPIGQCDGPRLLAVLGALDNPHRLRVIAALGEGRKYVSQLARELLISRPLMQVHLKKLQAAGLVRSEIELTDDGKAVHYFELVPFSLALTPQTLAVAARTLPAAVSTTQSKTRKVRRR